MIGSDSKRNSGGRVAIDGVQTSRKSVGKSEYIQQHRRRFSSGSIHFFVGPLRPTRRNQIERLFYGVLWPPLFIGFLVDTGPVIGVGGVYGPLVLAIPTYMDAVLFISLFFNNPVGKAAREEQNETSFAYLAQFLNQPSKKITLLPSILITHLKNCDNLIVILELCLNCSQAI